jgi:hypothetical protein
MHRTKVLLELLEERTAPAISITSLTNPSVFGQAVTFTGTAAGAVDNVSIEDVTSGVIVLASGVANRGSGRDYSLLIPVGAVGTHSIRAHDTTNGDISPILSEVVNKGGTITSVGASPNILQFGQAVTFTAAVHAAPPARGAPSGTVTFSEGGHLLGTGAVDGTGQATFSTTGLSAGYHAVSASYGGDNRFAGSGSPSCSLTVETPTAVSVSSAPNPSVFGELVTYTARVTATTPGAPTPVGTVTFTDGSTVLAANVGLDGNGVAIRGTAGFSVGSHTISVMYHGAGVFLPSTGSDAGAPQIVNRTGTATLIGASPVTSVYGQVVTYTASVTHLPPGAGIPSGTVKFIEGAVTLGTGTLNITGQATFGIATLSAGYHLVSASYGGDGNFTGSASGTCSISVETPTAVTVGSSPSPSVIGQPVTFIATVAATTPAAPTPTGLVTFLEGTKVLAANVGLSGAAQAIFGTSALSVGKHTITASYAGAGVFLASSGNATSAQVVGQGATAMTLSEGPDPSAHGQSITFTATVGVLGPAAGSPTGTATFSEGSTVLGSGAVNSAGQATFSTNSLSAGYHTVGSSYGGDGNFTGSTSNTVSLTVMAQTATSVSSSPAPAVFGQYVLVTATVSTSLPGVGTPFGTVTFREGTSVLAANLPLAGGVAILSTAALAIGSHTITATYSPLSLFLASSGSNVASPQVVVRDSTWTAVGSSTSTSAQGQAVTFTATIHATAPGFGTPTGTVAFTEGTAALGNRTLDATGRATLSISSLAVGKHTITATYSGSGNFVASRGSDSDYPQIIESFASATALTSSPNPSVSGQPVTFTAKVTSAGGTPTGTVDFTDSVSSGAAPQVWFTPNLNSDVIPMFQRPQDWQNARSQINVFKLEEPEIGNNPPAYFANTWQRLQSAKVVQTLKAWNIAFAFDAGVIKPEYLADPSLAVRDTVTAVALVAAAGGKVQYVSMDEPYCGGSIKFASMTATQIEDRVAAYMKSVNQADPTVQIGDIEPWPAINVPTIEAFINGLIARGTTPAFFHVDLNFGFVNSNPTAAAAMRVDMPALRDFFAQKNIPFGIIFWSGGTTATSDQDYSGVTRHNVDELKAAMGVPRQVIFQSWVPTGAGAFTLPTNLPETQPYTHTWLLDQGLQHLLSTTLAAVPLVGGVATFSTASLSAGNHTITASYSGDANFTASTGSDTVAPQVVHLATSQMAAAPAAVDTTRYTATGDNAGAIAQTAPSLAPDAVDAFFGLKPQARAGTHATIMRPRAALVPDDWLAQAF